MIHVSLCSVERTTPTLVIAIILAVCTLRDAACTSQAILSGFHPSLLSNPPTRSPALLLSYSPALLLSYSPTLLLPSSYPIAWHIVIVIPTHRPFPIRIQISHWEFRLPLSSAYLSCRHLERRGIRVAYSMVLWEICCMGLWWISYGKMGNGRWAMGDRCEWDVYGKVRYGF